MPAAPLTVPDRSGQPVAPGDHVRILDISPDPGMDEEDLELFREMVGSICEVERVDAAGYAWVTVWWATSEGSITTTAALETHQMQKIADA
ncbi:hypothetical protein [Azovibrio restrictus]|uniref:hypothetical protein n=1 Tax=Azovibrio restrictus TaxID=146938 RepID=UPI0026EA2B82|nr:hypothetical protein [Azovibrio restrictus]